jgi:hypothetical protein
MTIEFSNIENLLITLNSEENLHLENLTWIEPVGIAVLKLHKATYPMTEIFLQGNTNTIGYVTTLLNEHSSRERTYHPLEHFTDEFGDKDEIANNVTKKIIENANNLSDEDKQDFSKYLQYLISEMMDNVISHSNSSVGGFVTAQYYPRKNKVQVVIIDKGVGFLKTLENKYPLSNEQEAISKAIEKEVSGSNVFAPYTNVPKHAGLGLFFLSRIIQETNGSLMIVSNNTMYKSNTDSFKVLETIFQGTLIAFEIFENQLDYEFGQLFRIISSEGEESEEEDVF